MALEVPRSQERRRFAPPRWILCPRRWDRWACTLLEGQIHPPRRGPLPPCDPCLPPSSLGRRRRRRLVSPAWPSASCQLRSGHLLGRHLPLPGVVGVGGACLCVLQASWAGHGRRILFQLDWILIRLNLFLYDLICMAAHLI